MTGERALVVLIGSIIGWEAWCLRTDRHDELLSRVTDRLRARHVTIDVAAHAVIITTALHLTRRIPARLDPFSLVSA